MKNKGIIIGTLAVSLLSISSFASADFDCSTVDKEEIKTLMDKEKSGETLTTDETTLLENTKNCKMQRSGSGELSGSGRMIGERGFNMMSGSGMTQEQKAEMEAIKTIMDKKKNGETLTSQEEATLSSFESKRQSFSGSLDKNSSDRKSMNKSKTSQNSSALNDTIKGKIDDKVESLISSSVDTESQLNLLENFLNTIESMKTKVNSSTSYADSKKELYNSLFDYFQESINTKIENIKGTSSSDSVDQIMQEVFGE